MRHDQKDGMGIACMFYFRGRGCETDSSQKDGATRAGVKGTGVGQRVRPAVGSGR